MKLCRKLSVFAALAGAFAVAGCHKNSPANLANSDYVRAINAYWSVHPACLWPAPVQFPTQQDTAKTNRTSPYHALTDIGFLQRQTDETHHLLIGDKQVNLYGLTPQGRAAWTPDQTQPGYGNFCFGHRTVTSIDTVNATAASSPNRPATAIVNYHFIIKDAAPWLKNPEIENAFPQAAYLAGANLPDSATLSKTSAGWQM